MEFTHFNEDGHAHMVDVGEKSESDRMASASGRIQMSRECLEMVKSGTMKKGDVLGVARIAGIMAAKKTSELIPLCHAINLTSLEIDFEVLDRSCEIEAVCTAKCSYKTGVEMEALTGTTAALLTIYDMCKAVDKGMEIKSVCLMKKTGGKNGSYIREEA